MRQAAERRFLVRHEPIIPLEVERPQATFARPSEDPAFAPAAAAAQDLARWREHAQARLEAAFGVIAGRRGPVPRRCRRAARRYSSPCKIWRRPARDH
jgi:hypothetical protein